MVSPLNFDLLLLLLISVWFKYSLGQTLDAFDYDAYGERFAMSEHFSVLAVNDQRHFLVFLAPYSQLGCLRAVSYIHSSQYVYSVAVGSKQNASQLSFAYIAEYLNTSTTPATVQVFFVYHTVSNCNSSTSSWISVKLNSRYQRTSVLGFDPSGRMAYVISPTSNFLFRVDTLTTATWSLPWSSPWQFSPRAISVDSNQIAHVAGYQCLGDLVCFVTLVALWRDPLTATMKQYSYRIDGQPYLSGTLFSTVARNADLSLALNLNTKLFLLGIPYKDIVYIYNHSFNSTQLQYYYVSSFSTSQPGSAFGKSVSWLNNDTVAVLVYSLPTLPWSTSQIQVSLSDSIEAIPFCSGYFYSRYTAWMFCFIRTEHF